MQSEDIKIKASVNKQDSNDQCAFCLCDFSVDDEKRWDIYLCYLNASDSNANAFMVCDKCRLTHEELITDKPTFMQYADGDELYKVDDYVPLNY